MHHYTTGTIETQYYVGYRRSTRGYKLMPKQRPLDQRIRELKEKLSRLELQQKIATLRDRVSKRTPRRRR
jgi:hypothetical protein